MRNLTLVSILLLCTFTANGSVASESKWHGWTADFGTGGRCDLWNLHSQRNQPPIDFVNFGFIRHYDPKDWRSQKVDLPLGSLILYVTVPVSDRRKDHFKEVRSVSINDIKLNPVVEEQAKVMKGFFIGEPQSKKILKRLSENAATKLNFDIDQETKFSVEYAQREDLAFQIRKAQFEACVRVLSPPQ